MPRYIDADALVKRIACSPLFRRINNLNFPMKDAVIDLIDHQSTADVVEVRHGAWQYDKTYYEADECHCSECNQLMTTHIGTRMNYCPNCGAKMDGKVEDDVREM